MMNIIGALDVPTSGTYILNGQDVSEMNDDELAAARNREIGFVFQTFNLLPRVDCLANVELPLIYAGISKAKRKEMATKALQNVALVIAWIISQTSSPVDSVNVLQWHET